jgi:hypothetical protein
MSMQRRDSRIGYRTADDYTYCMSCWEEELRYDVPQANDEERQEYHFRLVDANVVEPIMGSDIGPWDDGFYCDLCGERLRKQGG